MLPAVSVLTHTAVQASVTESPVVTVTYRVFQEKVKGNKLKQSHFRLMEPRGFWEVKASRFRDIGT
jgi:hypothetical protein